MLKKKEQINSTKIKNLLNYKRRKFMRSNESGAFILSETKNGERIASCGGRISTRPGTAVELYKKATDKQKNLNLVSKVVSSGHKTILEHHHFNIAFNNVSIFVEQFLIEFRLASFTIKSGRYVNFSKAGFNLPEDFTEIQKRKITKHYQKMFKMYDSFVQRGVPVEDARFILPYGIKTNIYMSVNARELIHIICTMIYGRGKVFGEIQKLGLMLKEQFDLRYPGLIESNQKYYDSQDFESTVAQPCEKIEYVNHSVKLLSYPVNAMETLNTFASMTHQEFDFEKSLKNDKMARLLEHFNYTFAVKDFALIILKHFTRHRMQSLSTCPISEMVLSNRFVMPESISCDENLKADFEKCIESNRKLYNDLVSDGVKVELLIYITPHATATNFVTTINARELLHFCNLRTCNRAQWEIRYLATDMLTQLKRVDREMFVHFGPSCYTYGVCPEGRLCCGKQIEMKEKFENLE